MSHEVSAGEAERYARTIGPARDAVLEEMDRKAQREGFPTVGPAVGGWLLVLTRMVGAERAFEFGSGFGYSAYWIARGLPSDGTVILTEIHEEELEAAREFLERGGLDDRAVFEQGDAIEIIEAYDGPFELVLVDNEKDRYAEAFETVRPNVPPGGVVVADNVMGGPVEFETVFALVRGEQPTASERERGVADYLARVRNDDAFDTVLLPLGSGVAVSYRYS